MILPFTSSLYDCLHITVRSLTEKMASVSIADLHRVLNSADEKSLQIKKGIADRITEGISEGIVKPLDHIVYKTDEVETVIRDVANKLHNKKIIIKVSNNCFTLCLGPDLVNYINFLLHF